VSQISIAAEVRTSRGKNEARRTRRDGKIPAVVYGAYQDPVSVAVDPRELLRVTRSSTGYNTIFDIIIAGGETTPVMVVDQQVDPIRGNLLHADLKRIDLTKRIRITVPVHTLGEAKGVKVQGGLLEVITRAIEIECLPNEIPDGYTVDVTELMIGQSQRASDVALGASVKLIGSPDTVIAHVVALRAEVVETPAAEVAPTAAASTSEPEVIKKGKKEEEAEEKGKKK
jgi:large subunit ribosomal protein L25